MNGIHDTNNRGNVLSPLEEDSILDYTIRLLGNIDLSGRKIDRHDVREWLVKNGLDPDCTITTDKGFFASLLTWDELKSKSIEDCSKIILKLLASNGQKSPDPLNVTEIAVQLRDEDKETANKTSTEVGDASDVLSSIVIPDTNIRINKANLELLIQASYERALERDAARVFENSYPALFSISGTLLITILTSDFRDVLFLTSSDLKTLAWIAFLIFFLAGIVTLFYHFHRKTTNFASDRKRIIDELMEELYTKSRDEEF